MALVFQYGSNTSSSRLNSPHRIKDDAESIVLAVTVETFELDFTTWSKKNNCAAADLREGLGRRIYGVLYKIPDYLLARETAAPRKSLDGIEGRNYRRQVI